MTAQTFTPSEAAQTMGVTPQTVRRYCNRFHSHLSEGASPPKGQPRSLTIDDVDKLAQVAVWTQQGKTYDEIASLLASWQPTPSQTAQTASETQDVAPASLETVHMPDALTQALARIAERDSYGVQQVRGHVDRVHHEVAQLRTLVWVLAAIVFVLIVAVVALWVIG